MDGTGTPSLRLRGRTSVASLALALAAAGYGGVVSFKVPSVPSFHAPVSTILGISFRLGPE